MSGINSVRNFQILYFSQKNKEKTKKKTKKSGPAPPFMYTTVVIFWSCRKNGFVRNVRLTSRFMT